MFRKLKTLIGSAALALGISLNAPGVGAVELSMYYPVAVGGPLTKIVDGMVADFMKANPDIKVNAIYAGNYNDARIKALAALKSGKPAQLSVMFSIDIYELIEQGAIVAFDDIVETAEEKAWLKKFYPALMENGMTQGKVWGIPFQRSTIVMYYNKDAFRDAGLDPAKPPATWGELVSMGKKLVKKSGGQTMRWGAMIPSTGYPYWMFGALTKQNGQVLMNADGNKTYFDAPATVSALQFWHDLGNKHGVMPSGTIEWGTLRKSFLEGKTAIMWHSTGNLTVVKKRAKFDFGVAMLPASKGRGTPTGGGNFYIFKKSSPARTEGIHEVDPFPDTAAAYRRMEHEDGLHRHPSGCLRDGRPEEIRRQLPAGRRGSRPAQIRDCGAFDLSDRPRPEAAGRCHPGCSGRDKIASECPRFGPEAG